MIARFPRGMGNAARLADIMRTAAESLGIEVRGLSINGNRVSGVLRPAHGVTNRYQRVSANGVARGVERPRRVAAVCWHGHRDFFRACYAVNPNIVFRTGMAVVAGAIGPVVYNDADHFETTYRDHNPVVAGEGGERYGMQPVTMADACLCPEAGQDGYTDAERGGLAPFAGVYSDQYTAPAPREPFTGLRNTSYYRDALAAMGRTS